METWGWKEGEVRLAIGDVSLQFVHRDFSDDFVLLCHAVHVQIHDVSSDSLVSAGIMLILHDEDHIKPGKDSGLEIDILSGTLRVVVSSKDGIGRGKDGRAGVQDGGDTGFGNGDCLLLHCLMNGYSILVPHLVELVDTHNSSVCEHHRSSLQVEFS